MHLFMASPYRRSIALLFLVFLLNAPGFSKPVEPEPDEKIRKLEVEVERQSKQIEDLRSTIEALKNQLKLSPQDSNKAASLKDGSEAAAAQDIEEKAPLSRQQDEADEEDPGPEPPPPLSAGAKEAKPQSSATGQQPSMNPNISVIGLFEAKGGGAIYDPTRDSLYLRELELALQAPIDPYARADVFISFANGESPEVEEATLTWAKLPWGLQAKAGILKGDLGRINSLHSHALPQIDLPLPNQAIFGPESLHDPGVELSWLAPSPWYSRLSLQAMSRSSGASELDLSSLYLPTGSRLPLSSEEIVERLKERDDFSIFPSGASKNLLYLGRWENLWDLSENTTLGLGLSGAISSIQGRDLRSSLAYGADLTLKWHPLDKPYRSIVWQTEFLRARQQFMMGNREFGGWYSFLNYRWDRNWAAGLRYDMTELPFDSSLVQRRGSALLEWIPSEFSRLRLQYNLNTSNYRPSFSEVMLQWNVVLGPHGAHKY